MNVQQAGIRSFLPLLFVFILVSSFTIVVPGKLLDWNIDQGMLISGNIILFGVTLLSFVLHRKALFAGNTHLFLRNVYSGMGVKFFVCIFAALIYIFTSGNAVNKPGLFTLMFLYFLYTFLEVMILLKVSRQIKQKKNG